MSDDSDDKQATSNPLFRAPPPDTATTSSQIPAAPPVASGSKQTPAPVTTDPLYGATPSTPYTSQSGHVSPPAVPRRSARLPLHHPSPLPAYLRRLGYILSLVLGSSAVIAGIWSVFILPLLHSTFSARKALVEQQKDRWSTLITSLREIRAGKIYDGGSGSMHEGEEQSEISHEGQEAEEARLIHQADDDKESRAMDGLLPISPFSTLSTSLSNLVSALMSTSTTRTSLLSTLESYTSTLHRQVYIRSQPLANRYGLGTLSANLARAGGGQAKAWPYDRNGDEEKDQDIGEMGVKGEEWDAVRKEVRTIKGMLLSRRNFAPMDQAAR